jgi:hypothetical protein
MKITILDPEVESKSDDGVVVTSGSTRNGETSVDVYFSADVETDGPIPGPYSILSFALVFAGTFDGSRFKRPDSYQTYFYKELRPISHEFQDEALRVNGLDRARLSLDGETPEDAFNDAFLWIKGIAGTRNPVLVAFPLSFDWTWLYWYFTRFCSEGSPFGHSQCFDIKTAVAVKAKMPISLAARSRLPDAVMPRRPNTHHALDDAIAQAEIFANVFEWKGL